MTSNSFFDRKKTDFDRLTDEDKQGIQVPTPGYRITPTSKTERDAGVWKSPAWLRARASVPGRTMTHFVRATRSTISVTKGIMLAVIGEPRRGRCARPPRPSAAC